MINILVIQLLWHQVFAETVFHYLMFEIVTHVSIALRSNFDIKSSSQEKLDTENSVNAEESVNLNMSSNSSSAENTSMLNSEQTVIYMFLFSKSETSEASYFSKADVMKFLHWFYKLKKHHEIRDENLIKMLSNYYEHEKCSHIRA